MAEKKTQGQRESAKRKTTSSDSQSRERRTSRRPTSAEVAKGARRELAEITGLDAEAVTSLEQTGDKTWRVRVELLELSRVPNTDDVLGSYEVQLDEDGALLGYRRLRRYPRSHAGEEEGVRGGS